MAEPQKNQNKTVESVVLIEWEAGRGTRVPGGEWQPLGTGDQWEELLDDPDTMLIFEGLADGESPKPS